jgi:hypothetical protein
LLSAILADGINLGLNRMADAIRGVTYRQLALVHNWHIPIVGQQRRFGLTGRIGRNAP